VNCALTLTQGNDISGSHEILHSLKHYLKAFSIMSADTLH